LQDFWKFKIYKALNLKGLLKHRAWHADCNCSGSYL
jgi:hypothetical protein